MKYLLVLIAGILFGLGLSLSQMINPTVVIGFLDITGDWNPALMFVMVGALLVTTIGFRFVLKKDKPWFDSQFHLPIKQHLDKSLIIGAVIFGIGWGLAGYCPGPAVAGLALGQLETLYFVIAMILGIKCAQLIVAKRG
ncbi:YeeE/YedE family protein [Thalassotalea marina]|uniref:YeeE/YedE family protein n=1 Tax=Thalassotalea marina TaxID=1673741 RepID=A0A919EH32_9GAMM|nr:YeeE/YedE family protein [Thalassotalea marina]GHF77264.1 hypothetical protein GCM10017161_00290 [Thalassotalea marina]